MNNKKNKKESQDQEIEELSRQISESKTKLDELEEREEKAKARQSKKLEKEKRAQSLGKNDDYYHYGGLALVFAIAAFCAATAAYFTDSVTSGTLIMVSGTFLVMTFSLVRAARKSLFQKDESEETK